MNRKQPCFHNLLVFNPYQTLIRGLLYLFLFFFAGNAVFGQNGVTISSNEPDPTSNSPIPINIHFDDGVDNLQPSDFTINNGSLTNIKRLIPDFEIYADKDLGNFDVNPSFFELISNIGRINDYFKEQLAEAIISIDLDSSNNLYYLTFSDGVYKYNPTGSDERIITADNFQTPLDLVISSNDQIIVADKDKYKVRVYDINGNFKYDIGGAKGKDGNEFYGPTGLSIDKNNKLYVADAYTGSDPDGIDQIKMYQIDINSSSFLGRYGDQLLNDPYRIAVDSNNFVYVSDSGGNSGLGRVLIFKPDNSYDSVIEGNGLGSPGSLILDNYGYLYVINYEDDLSFNGIFQDPLQLARNYEKIKNKRYSINVYNKQHNLITSFNQNLNLPIDIAIDNCGSILVNNLELGGTINLNSFKIDATFNFNLKKFKRKDNFSADIIPNTAGLVEVSLENKNLFTCGPQPKGDFSITYQIDAPVVNCKPTILYLDSEGKAVLDPKAIFDGDVTDPSIDSLEAGQENFSCADLGSKNVKLTGYFKNGTSNFCTSTVLVKDTISPQFTACDIEDIHIELKEGETYTVPDFTSQLTATDNCDNSPIISQDIEAGKEISEIQTIILTATDVSENDSNACSVKIIITQKPKPSFDCPDPNLETVLEKDENCDFEVPDYSGKITGFKNFENNPYFVQTSSRNGNILSVTINVFDGENGDKVRECTFPVMLVDNIPPTFTCPKDILVPYTTSKEYTVKDYFSELEINDNCSQTFTHTQTPNPGTVVHEDTKVEFTVTDESENKSTCSFNIKFYQETQLQILNCPGSQTIEVDSNCSYLVPDITSIIETNIEDAVVSQSINAGIRINGPQTLIITSSFEDQSDTCEVNLIPEDTTPPEVSCPPNQNETVEAGEGFQLPNYTLDASASDNCEIASFEQQPEPGTIIYESTKITLTAKDNAGLASSCTFTVTINENNSPNPPVFDNCPTAISKSNDAGICGAVITFETPTATDSNGEPASVTQTAGPASGAIFPVGTTRVTFTATDNLGSSSQCSFKITVTDTEKPTIACPDPININYTGSWSLPDYSKVLNSTDNCTDVNNLIFNQTPVPGTNYIEDGPLPVTVSVTDENGNIATCNFIINLNTETTNNQPPTATDDEYQVLVNGALQIDSANGVLTNDTDPENDDLTAVLGSDVSHGTLILNDDGSFQYTPNSGFIGTDNFTYVANDGSLNSEEATVTITVYEQNPTEPDFSCKDSLTVELDENGEVEIAPEDLYTGTATNYTFSIDKSIFTCADIGQNTVRLSYTENGTTDYCDVNVLVKDNLPPIVKTKDITITLNSNGEAVITPQMLDNGTVDNCSDVVLSLDKYNFNCNNLGENVVTLTASDGQGNLATAPAVVTVTGNCGNAGPSGDKYIFIYPNPTEGAFTFYVPKGKSISRVEVFDMHARYILSKDFPEGTQSYNMDITGLQEAVYILKLTTSEGEKIIRIIKK